MTHKKFSKIIASFLILSFCIFPVMTPRVTMATDGIGGGVQAPGLGVKIVNWLTNKVGTGSEVSGEVAKFSLEVVLKAVATSILNTLVTEVINWGAGGFEGNPFAVENQTNHMYNIKSEEIVRLYNEVSGNTNFGGFTSAPAFKSLIGVVEDELTPFTEKIKPTISAIEKADFKSDFSKGGWDTYIKQADMQNNNMGTRILTLTELDKRVSSRQHTEEQKLLQGAGIQAATKCVGGFVSDMDTGFEYCKQEVVQTAGKLVGDQISKATGAPQSQAELTAATGGLGAVVSSVLSGLLTSLIYKGLGSIGGDTPESVSPYESLLALTDSPEFGSANQSKRFAATEIIDMNKELNQTIDLTKRDIEENFIPTIDIISKRILNSTIALDQCVLGPHIGFEDRLKKVLEYRVTEKGIRKSAQDGDQEDARNYSEIQRSFAEYMGEVGLLRMQHNLTAIAPRSGSAIEWQDQVNELDNFGSILSNMQDTYMEKQKVLARLQSIQTTIQQMPVFDDNNNQVQGLILFNEQWNSLSAQQKSEKFLSILANNMISLDEWNDLENPTPLDEKRRIAQMFNINFFENTTWAPTAQQIERLALYEVFNLPVLNITGTGLSSVLPTENETRNFVISHDWNIWEKHMNRTESLQEQRTSIIQEIVQSRETASTEASYARNKETRERVTVAAQKLVDSVYSCQRARYEIVHFNDVLKNKRTLVLPESTLDPADDEVPFAISAAFNTVPGVGTVVGNNNILIPTGTFVEKHNNTLYLNVPYTNAVRIRVEYFHNYGISNGAINGFNHPTLTFQSLEYPITSGQETSGSVLVQLSGDTPIIIYDNNNDSFSYPGNFSLSTLPAPLNTETVVIRACAVNSLGETCTDPTLLADNTIQTVAQQPEEESLNLTQPSFGVLQPGYTFFGVNINNGTFEKTIVIDGKVVGTNIAGKAAAGTTGPNKILVLKKSPDCPPAWVAIFTGGIPISQMCSAITSATTFNNVPGIPLLDTKGGLFWNYGELAQARSVAIQLPVYEVDDFVARMLQDGLVDHRNWHEAGHCLPGQTYPDPTNCTENQNYTPLTANNIQQGVIVVRNWNNASPNSQVGVIDDYMQNFACDFGNRFFGRGHANYWGIKCSEHKGSGNILHWYTADKVDYLKLIYPRIQQYMY